MRRLANAETFVVMTGDHTYQVTLEHTSNAKDWTPKYKAYIVMQNDVCRNATTVNISVSNPQVIPVYSFKGHLFPLQQEAEWIVKEHLKSYPEMTPVPYYGGNHD